MTSIKPPSLPAAAGPELSQGPAGAGAAQVQQTGEPSFAQALDQAQASGVSSEAPVGRAGGDPIAELSRELSAGRLSVDEACSRLIDRAASGVAASLGAAERADLLEVLRAALASDPTLSALRESLR